MRPEAPPAQGHPEGRCEDRRPGGMAVGSRREVAVSEVRPSRRMRDLGVVQHGTGLLAEPAAPFDLPAGQDAATDALDQLSQATDRIAQAHDFSGKGMGLAPHRSASAAQPRPYGPPNPGARPIVLLNPRITAACDEMDEQ